MNSAIHRGIVEPYWFFEDWDLSNLSLEVREVLKIQSESNEPGWRWLNQIAAKQSISNLEN